MSEVKVNKLSPRSGTTVTLGDSGDTFTVPSGVTFDASSGGLAGTLTTAAQPNITSVGTLTSFASTGIDDNATSTAITIDSSENVGIGTTSPSSKLDIYNGTINVDTTGSSLFGTRYTSGSGSNNILLYKSQSDTIGTQSALSNGSGIGGIITRASDGTSFINTTAIFHQVDGTVSTNSVPSRITFSTNSGSTSYSERMRIDSSGNVGIGTSSPDVSTYFGKILHIADASNAGIMFNRTSSTAAKWSVGCNSGGNLDFVKENSVKMRIDSAGGVGINATPDSNNFLLKITHDGNSKYALNANSSNTSGTQYHIVFQRNGSTAGYITSNSATTIAVNNASDERLKENIQNSGSAIQDIQDIQVRQFDWKDGIDTHRDFGFVAQELVNVVPEAVTQGTDELDDNGKPVRSWGVDYSHIVPRLVKVCQEQQTKIEELEARITTLENA